MQARTWARLPGAPVAAGSTTAWIESTTTSDGRRVVHRAGQGGEVRAVEDHEPGGERPEALGPAPDLGGRLLGRDEQHRRRRLGPSTTAPGAATSTSPPPARRPAASPSPGRAPLRAPGRARPAPWRPAPTGPGRRRRGRRHGRPPQHASTRPDAPGWSGVEAAPLETRRGDGVGQILLDEAVPLAAPRAPPRPPGRDATAGRHRCTVRSRPTPVKLGTGCDTGPGRLRGRARRSECQCLGPGPQDSGRQMCRCVRSRRPRRPARPAAARDPRRCGRRTRRPPRPR